MPRANSGPMPGSQDMKTRGRLSPVSEATASSPRWREAAGPQAWGRQTRVQNCSSLPLTLCRLNSQEFLNPKREVKHSTGNFWTRPELSYILRHPAGIWRLLGVENPNVWSKEYSESSVKENESFPIHSFSLEIYHLCSLIYTYTHNYIYISLFLDSRTHNFTFLKLWYVFYWVCTFNILDFSSWKAVI